MKNYVVLVVTVTTIALFLVGGVVYASNQTEKVGFRTNYLGQEAVGVVNPDSTVTFQVTGSMTRVVEPINR